jgi:hypothetical protein
MNGAQLFSAHCDSDDRGTCQLIRQNPCRLFPQGLKPDICFVAFAARLKPCPDTKREKQTHVLRLRYASLLLNESEKRWYFAAPLQGAIL